MYEIFGFAGKRGNQSNAYYVLAVCELDGKYIAYQWKSIQLLTDWRFQAQLAHWALQLGGGSRHEKGWTKVSNPMSN